MFTRLMQLLTILSLSLYSSDSSAKIFKLSFTPGAGTPPEVTDAIESELQKIEDDANDGLPKSNTPDEFMDGMANSSVMSGKGVGSDYASGMRVILIGAGVGLGAAVDAEGAMKGGDSNFKGAGFQGGLILGTHLGWLDTQKIMGLETDRLNVYLNFFSYTFDKNFGENSALFETRSFGMHVSYDLIKPRGNILLGWGGIKIHTGYEYNRLNLDLAGKIKGSFSESDGAGNTYDGSLDASPKGKVEISTHSIPIEISTSLQFLYFVSLYGGVGADYNMGFARGEAGFKTDSNIQCSGATCGAIPDGTVTAIADVDADGSVNPFLFRGFAGLQLNLPFIRIYAQANKAIGQDLVGASVGLRLVY
jgi:hypothetical protein